MSGEQGKTKLSRPTREMDVKIVSVDASLREFYCEGNEEVCW